MHTRGIDVFLALLDERGAAHRSRVIGPLHRDQRDHDLVDALAEHREQHQRDEDRRKRKLQVDDAHDRARRSTRPRNPPRGRSTSPSVSASSVETTPTPRLMRRP